MSWTRCPTACSPRFAFPRIGNEVFPPRVKEWGARGARGMLTFPRNVGQRLCARAVLGGHEGTLLEFPHGDRWATPPGEEEGCPPIRPACVGANIVRRHPSEDSHFLTAPQPDCSPVNVYWGAVAQVGRCTLTGPEHGCLQHPLVKTLQKATSESSQCPGTAY